MWPLVLVASLGCWLEKVAGLLVPQQLLAGARTRLAVAALPVALLTGLVVTGTVADGRSFLLDARLVGIAVAVVLAVLRAPLLGVLLPAIAATALARALGMA